MVKHDVTSEPQTFLDQVLEETPGDPRLEMCIQCGTCGGSCPSGQDMEQTPRAIFQMIKAGMKNETLSSNTPWFCVSCYYCTTRCPQQIHITDIMYTLKRMAIREGKYRESTASSAPHFSGTFIDYVENYGRSFELGLATRYHLRHNPLNMVQMAPMGMGMIIKGRMDLMPTRIKGMNQLKAILSEAKKIGGTA